MVTKSFKNLLEIELTSISTDHWSDHLPIHVSSLRYLEQIHPKSFSFERAYSSEKEQSFEGNGAPWYEKNIWKDPKMQELSHSLMIEVLKDIITRYPDGVDTPSVVKIPTDTAEQIEFLLRDRTSHFP